MSSVGIMASMASVVLTVIGDDRPGLVDQLAEVIARHDGSWESSSMARLATKFAGIVEVRVAPERAGDLIEALDEFDRQGTLDVRAERSDGPAETTGVAVVELELVGQDRPGIVREVAHALADAGVSIDELTTWTTSAPMSGEPLFQANALLSAPAGLDRQALTGALEAVADELMVDIELRSDTD